MRRFMSEQPRRIGELLRVGELPRLRVNLGLNGLDSDYSI